MNRRECLTYLGASTLAASRAVAQGTRTSGPTIRLFGIAFIKEEGAVVKVVMPASHGHKTFVVGLKGTVEALCGGMANTAQSYNLQVGHKDLENNPQAHAGCLGPRELSVKSSTSSPGVIDPELMKALPNVLTLAAKADPAGPYSLWRPDGSVVLYLTGGRLVHTTPSTNPGSAPGVDWAFYKGTMPLNVTVPRLADVADFLSAGPATLVTLNGSINLRDDERVWFVNVPVYKAGDATKQIIEHIHEYLDCVQPQKGFAGVVAKTNKPVTAGGGSAQFDHPCGPEVKARWYPPDSDPCFMMTF